MEINEDFVKLKIDGILDLENLSTKFLLTKKELIMFHNSHCEINLLLPQSLPKYVEYIYLPKSNYFEWKLNQLPSPILKLPDQKSFKQYGVLIKYLAQKIELNYQITIDRKNEIVEITKTETYINNQNIDLLVEQLIEKASQVIYPLRLQVDTNGVFKKILNGDEIKKRWKNDVEPELTSYYKAEIAEKIINQLDLVFTEINNKKDLLKNDLFYQLYFAPIYQDYSNDLKTGQFTIFLSSINTFIDYNVKYSLKNEYSSTNKIILNVNGIDNSDDKYFELTYKFHKTTNQIYSIIGKFHINHTNTLHQIHFEMYELT